MADDVIKTITIKGKTEGVDQATAALKKLADAQGNVAVVSDTTSKSAVSVEQAYARQTLRVDEAARMQARIATETKTANAALAQGLITHDEHAKRLGAINDKYGQATPLQQAFSKSLQGIQGQMVALSAGAGPVGVFLAALGPWGMAAAVGIGSGIAAFNSLNDAAHRAAERGTELRRFNETTGISIDVARGLGKAAAQMGIDSDSARGAIEKFVIAWEEARLGQGNMLQQMEKTDLGLAREIQTARSGVTAFDALAAAIRKAVDEGNRGEALRLARAAGGRGGAESIITMALAATAVGGAENLRSESSRLTSQQLEDLSKMAIKLREMQKAADDAWTAFGGKQAMQIEMNWASAKKQVGDMASSLADLASKGEYWGMVWQRTKALFTNQPLPKFPWQVPSSGAEPNEVWSTGAQAAQAAKAPLTPEARLDISNKQMALLGSAATQTELLAHKQQELAVSSKLVEGGAALAARQINDMRISTTLANDAARQSLGVSSQEEIVKSRLLALSQQEAKGLQLTNAQHEQATTIIQREARAQAEANQVRASALPGLKQMELDAGRLDKQLDTVATTSLNNLSSALVAIGTHTQTAGQAFKAFGLQVATSLQQMIVQLLIIKPLAAGLGGGLSGFFGGGAKGVVPGTEGAPGLQFHDGGIVGMGGTPRMIHPAYYENAPRYHMGVDEVPAILQTGERVLNRREAADYNRGGSSGPSITIVNNMDFRGADPGSEARMRAYVDESSRRTVVASVQAVARARSSDPKYLAPR